MKPIYTQTELQKLDGEALQLLAYDYCGAIYLQLPNISRDKLIAEISRSFVLLEQLDFESSQSRAQMRCEEVLARNAPVVPTKLFGVDQILAKLHGLLLDDKIYLLSVTGAAGLGKTSLTYELVKTYGANLGFKRFAWVSSSRKYISGTGELRERSDPPLAWSDILEEIAQQLRLGIGYSRTEWAENFKQQIRQSHKDDKCLVIIDNFETILDSRAVEYLYGLFDTQTNQDCHYKFIITSRESFEHRSDNHREIALSYLDEPSAVALIRHVGQERRDIEHAPSNEMRLIVQATHGNPLLIRVVVNQCLNSNKPLSKVLAELLQVSNPRVPTKDLLEFLYNQSFDQLESNFGLELILRLLDAFSGRHIIHYDELFKASGIQDEAVFEKVLEYACKLHVIETSGLETIYSTHTLIINAFDSRTHDISNKDELGRAINLSKTLTCRLKMLETFVSGSPAELMPFLATLDVAIKNYSSISPDLLIDYITKLLAVTKDLTAGSSFVDYLDRVISLFDELGYSLSSLYCAKANHLRLVETRSREREMCLRLALQCSKTVEEELICLIQLGEYFVDTSTYQQAIEEYFKCEQLIEKHPDILTPYQCKVYVGLATTYFYLLNYKVSFQYFSSAQKLADPNDACILADILHFLGRIAAEQARFLEAMDRYLAGLRHQKDCSPELQALAFFHIRISELLIRLNLLSEARSHLTRCQQLFRSIEYDGSALVQVELAWADTYFAESNLDNAERDIYQAIRRARQINYPRGELLGLEKLFRLQLRQGQLFRAFQTGALALRAVEMTTNNKYQLIRTYATKTFWPFISRLGLRRVASTHTDPTDRFQIAHLSLIALDISSR